MMSAEEWQTYLALQFAGPRKFVPAARLVAPPPWGRGEIGIQEKDAGSPSVHALQALLLQRRSVRDLATPVDLTVLLQVLHLALARPDSSPLSRHYPTSGGCDELGILVAARRVKGLPEGAYWAATDTMGSLLRAASLSPVFDEFERIAIPYLGLSRERTPAVTLLILADWRKLSARYEHCVLASALWDSGTLLQTLSLAAAAVGVHACISACIQPELIATWLGIACEDFGHIATLSLGGKASSV